MRMQISGRAKNVILPHGAYLNRSSQPCKRHCPRRSEDCHAKCKEWSKWEHNHRLALEEEKQHLAEMDISNLKPKSRSEWDKYRIPNKNIYKKQEEKK